MARADLAAAQSRAEELAALSCSAVPQARSPGI